MKNNFIIIDLGTNSALFTVVSIKRSSLIISYDKSITTRIGLESKINDKKLKNTINIIKKELNFISKNFKFDKIIGIATAGFRKAKNGKEIIKRINKEICSEINLISSKDEILYTEKALNRYKQNSTYLLADIGGGSTEIIIGSTKKSIKVGAISIEKKFNLSKNKLNVEKAIKYVKNKLPKHKNIKYAVFSGGTATTLAAINKNLKKYNPKAIEGIILDTKNNLFKKIIKSSKKTLEPILTLSPRRVGIISSGTSILQAINEKYNVKKNIITTIGPRHGYLISKYNLDIKNIRYKI